KAFMDGALGSQTALMLDGSGVEIMTSAELEQIIRRGAAAGMPVAVHAIGDLANRNALDAFERTRDVWRGLRPRIEHAQCLAPAWLSGDARRRGRLLPGFLADLVVLDRDPFAVEPAALREVEVVATMVGGRWVYGAPPWG